MYILEVNTPNKLLMHKGRSIRTPATFTITKEDIKKYKVLLHQAGVEEYSIRSKSKVDVEDIALPEQILPTFQEIQEEVKIEILDDEDETRSILDQLVKDAKEDLQ